jgi:hypothetical protein
LVSENWTTARTLKQTIYDWKEFAERNGINVPENISKFWDIDATDSIYAASPFSYSDYGSELDSLDSE